MLWIVQCDKLTKIWVWESFQSFSQLFLHFTFRSMIHFMKGIKSVLRYMFFGMWISI